MQIVFFPLDLLKLDLEIDRQKKLATHTHTQAAQFQKKEK